MQAYPGRGNPILDALHGRISVRQLRVMIENLPPDNPVAWELRGDTWGEQERLLHDISSYIRAHRTDDLNRNRKKGSPEIEYKFYQTPQERQQEPVDTRTAEQVKVERDHLQQVLARTRARQQATRAGDT